MGSKFEVLMTSYKGLGILKPNDDLYLSVDSLVALSVVRLSALMNDADP